MGVLPARLLPGGGPRSDQNLKALWGGFESFLLQQLPHPIERIVTPGWEPIYDERHADWSAFLTQQGYSPIGDRAFGKEVETVTAVR
jgi:hypothetical protein